MLIDSWNRNCNDAVNEAIPPNKNDNIKIILKEIAGKIESLDAFGFKIWKNYVRRSRQRSINE